ncbi:MAG TPA: hypothetical protein DIW31_12490 [Bacteroidales bacterium]|nr:hypothetical protein [Bacteroidales bacterium]
MIQKILFGGVEIVDTRTNKIERVDRKIYLENETPNNASVVEYFLREKNPKERKHFRVSRICKDTAKVIGVTNY